MSAFISLQDQDSICLLTDGAGYDEDGYILSLGRKVYVGSIAKIAVTTRGNQNIGNAHARRLCEAADKLGVDWALECFQDALPTLAAPAEAGVWGLLHWHIAAWSETQGLVRYSAHNLPQAFSDGEEPLTLNHIPAGKTYSAANAADMQTLMACGVRPMMPGERLSEYMEKVGANIMEAQRRTAANLLEGEKGNHPQYLVGGQCDLTVIDRDGVKVTTLRTWPDKIGELINPFSDAGNVVRLPRQQRRALEREQRKLAKKQRQSA